MAQQIKKKFIADNAIDGTKIKLEESQAIRGVKSGVEVDMLKFDENGVLFSEEKELSFKSDMESHVESIRSTLDASIQQEVSDRQSEITRVEGLLSDEESARIAADALKVDKAGDNMTGTLYLPEICILDNINQTQLNFGIGREDYRGVGNHYLDLSNSLYVNSDLGGTLEFGSGFGHIKVQVTPTESDDVVRKLELDQEVSDRQSEITRMEGLISNEESARIAADSSLDSKITTEKERIDAILLASEADKDSFAEIVQLINSVDTENDQAFASYVLSNDAALAQEVQDRTDADTNLQSNIDAVSGNLDQEILDRQADVNAEETRALAAEGVLQGNIDQEVSDRQSEISRVEGLLSDEESARIAADALKVDKAGDTMTGLLSVQRSQDSEVAIESKGQILVKPVQEGQNPDGGIKIQNYIGWDGNFVSAEMSFQHVDLNKPSLFIGSNGLSFDAPATEFSNQIRLSIDEMNGITISSGFDLNTFEIIPFMPTFDNQLTPKHYVDSQVSTAQGNLTQEVADRQSEILRVEGLISDEETRALAAEGVLDNKITTEKERIDAILLASDADKDSFAEIVSLINSVDTENDSAFASYVLSNDARSTQIESDLSQEALDRAAADSTLQGNIDVVSANLAQEILDRQADVNEEETRALAAESLLSGRLDVLEALSFEKESFTLTSGQDTLTLAQTPKVDSTVMFVGRLALHEGSDYTISGNVVTFIGDFHPTSGDEIAAEEGDVVKVTYYY